MFRRTEVAPDGSGREPGATPPAGATAAGNFVVDPEMPNFSGDLDALLTTAPVFRSAVRGYDRLQVDNYVSWAESELRAARRETDDLVDRYGRACAELEISRRLLARSPEGQEMTVISERMGQMLRMAADEAAALTAAGSAEADQILADARTNAERLEHESKTKSDQLEADARTRSQMLDSETAERRTQLFGDLEREQGRLNTEVENLRAFEREYRSRLKSYFSQQLAALETNESSSTESSAAASLEGSGDPAPKRLRALLGEEEA